MRGLPKYNDFSVSTVISPKAMAPFIGISFVIASDRICADSRIMSVADSSESSQEKRIIESENDTGKMDVEPVFLVFVVPNNLT